MTKLYDDFLEPSGVTVCQFSLLKHIKALGTVSVSELASTIRLDRTTLVRNLQPLEEARCVVDVSTPGSRRRALMLTNEGAEKLDEAERLWTVAQSHVEHSIGKDEVAQLNYLLTRVENLR